MLTLKLEKPGVAAPKLRLSLNKGARFKVKVEWHCDAGHIDDVDVHALEARNDGSGAKVAELINKYGLLAMPVVNEEGVMLGIITVDDVLDILMPEPSKLDTYFSFAVRKLAGRRVS